VEYSLTPLGHSLSPVIRAMCEWGVMYHAGQLDNLPSEPFVADLITHTGEPALQPK